MAERRRTFGNTWWGQAWLDALEGRAVHDPNRLPRGRTYARRGSAHDLAIEHGSVRAAVRGSRPEPYEVLLQIRQFRVDEWDWVLDAIASRAAHAAALLEGELDPAIVADAREAEVEILPRSGELRTACTCPDWAEPCKHAAAVCYLIADAIDDDPFVIFRLRGMDRTGILDAIRERRAEAAGGGPSSPPPLEEPGVVARQAWGRVPDELPAPPAPPTRPGRPAPWPTDPPVSASFDGPGLRRLAADAARRAWHVRRGTARSGLDLDEVTDLARWVADATPSERAVLYGRGHLSEAHLDAQAMAWRVAGAAGVRALDEPAWTPPVGQMVAARDALVAAGVGGSTVQVRSNRLTVGGVEQYRLSRDGLWYRFVKQSGRWVMTSAPAADLDELLDPDLGDL